MAVVTIVSRKECHLCDEAKAVLLRVRREVAFDLDERDVDADEDLRARYSDEVPVVLVDGRKLCKYRVDEKALRARLAR